MQRFSCQIVTVNKPAASFLRARCRYCHPTMATNNVTAVKRKNITVRGLADQPGGLPTLTIKRMMSSSDKLQRKVR